MEPTMEATSSRSHQRRKRIGVALAAAGGIVLLGALSNIASTDTSIHRQASEALPDGGCFVTPSVAAPDNIRPVFAASYPGSGARMTWNLVEALTGIVTGDDWDSNGWGSKVVSVKTHYPHPHGKEVEFADEIERAFVVLRNPLRAIPSFHNFLYEYENGLENHSTRAPVSVWLKWRDDNFHRELKHWMEHLEFWLDNYEPENRVVIAYEDLTDDERGPYAALLLNRFLGAGPGVEPIAEDSVECVWRTVVKYKDSSSKEKGKTTIRHALDKDVEYVGNNPLVPGSNRSGDKTRDYTIDQLYEALLVVQHLQDEYGGEKDEWMDLILGGYVYDIKSQLIEMKMASRKETEKELATDEEAVVLRAREHRPNTQDT